MGLSPLSPKSVAKESRRLGVEMLHASATSSGRVLVMVGSDLNVYEVDRKTGEVWRTDERTTSSEIARQVVWSLLGGEHYLVPWKVDD